MAQKIVDARGEVCPKPLIMTKKALNQLAVNETMVVQIDNETSKQNVERFLKDNHMDAQVRHKEGFFELLVTKRKQQLSHPDAAAYCTPEPRKPHVVAVSSDTMGSGDHDLGEILIKAFINTLHEVEPLPGAIVFYNRGIFLALENSPVIDSLHYLHNKGVEILVCGTCADYFDKKSSVKVGVISNMYTILETLTRAGHVVKP
ncbi:MAG: sulfurtransferase-like selenium metabolism protein YedF [Chitinivibrionales bacterium]